MAELKEKLYQMFILGLDGGGYKQVLHQGLGGVIFLQKIFNPKINSKI